MHYARLILAALTLAAGLWLSYGVFQAAHRFDVALTEGLHQ